MSDRIRVEEFTSEGYYDVVSVVKKRFPVQAVAVHIFAHTYFFCPITALRRVMMKVV